MVRSDQGMLVDSELVMKRDVGGKELDENTTILGACADEIAIWQMLIKIIPVKAECSFLRLA